MSENSRGQVIPAFVNRTAGSAETAAEALATDNRFALREVEAGALHETIRAEIDRDARRIVIAGGHGSISTAAGAAVGKAVELAIVPGGTLNHIAKNLGIPTDLKEALETAAGRSTRTVDVGLVNDRIFLNTSSVGAYVRYVRTRERPLTSQGVPPSEACCWASAWEVSWTESCFIRSFSGTTCARRFCRLLRWRQWKRT